ncbi:indolepyruvate ferredoxin oxidoreductase subunit alpha [Caldicellulosiruptor morganii]|uniref:Indolepyruvate oxidoreductase subunit IorA n=1 Tax=Caldicellulosiruptor morganii TaxID=1387555 RepID=A0ABY7BS58_9FIRM|nr:indolepyruvate ferredoxin oxidoreductase subunit alpha [Caldicellulosiruptor morganii]WAM34755.1 indolepyruvate ferredoxin oxidoreductase subunit alpha [Caldicellulosiruptor morganii]
MKKVLMGNEAVAYSLYINGVNVAVGYPGTPSTEVIETLKNFSDDHFYVEWSVNEKVALEIAAGASLAGARSVVTMKQVGLNVAADPLLSLSIIGIEGGMIVFVADDPGPHSSQTEQDTRNFARFCNLPVFDPSSPKEAFSLVKEAYEVSEKYKLPVIFRMTTRVCHSNETLEFEFERRKKEVTGFEERPQWVILPGLSYIKHVELEEKLTEMKSELGKLNIVEGDGQIGIVTSGVSYFYVKEAIKGFEDLFSILKITVAHPIDDRTILEFCADKKMLIFIEELDPVVEEETKLVLFENRIYIPTYGKRNGYVPYAGELDVDKVKRIIFDITKEEGLLLPRTFIKAPEIPRRQSQLCAGCPHRSSFLIVKSACKGKDVIYTGDIGCYTLGFAKPISATHTCLCMGASVTMAQGLKIIENKKKIVAFIGDSTFFHSGITGLVNAYYNRHNITVCVLDNLTTGMTGFQPHPGVGQKVNGENGQRVEIADLVKGMGIKNVLIIDPYDNFDLCVQKVREFIEKDELSVIIFRHKCANLEKNNYYYRINEKCTNCKACISATGCPAIGEDENKNIFIDQVLCNACGLCTNFCPNMAIEKVVER